MYAAQTRTVKASVWFTMCNVILKGIAFVSIPIFTRLLSSSEYGILTVYMSFEQIILTLATWETSLSAYQKGLFKYKKDTHFFNVSTLAISNISTVIFFLLAFLLFPIFHSTTGISIQNTIWLFVYMIVQPAYSCWLVEKRTQNEYVIATIVTVISSVITVLVPIIALLTYHRTADVKFKYTLIASIFVYVIFYIRRCNYLSLLKNKQLVKEQWKFIISFQVPIVVHALSYTILAQADRIMIERMVGPSQAAFYSVAYSVVMVAAVFQYSINQAIVPWRFEKLEKKEYSIIRKNTTPMLVFIGLITLVFVFVSPEIIYILFSNDYYEAIWCMPPIGLSVYFMFLYTLFVWVENYYEKTKYVALVSIICAALNVFLNYIFIPTFGYKVCGYTTLVSYIVFCVGHYCFMNRVLMQCGIKEEIYDIKACIVIATVLIGGMIIAVLTYNSLLIRYAILLTIGVGLYIKRNKIRSVLQVLHKKDVSVEMLNGIGGPGQ